jgi:hypothetical protein
MRLLVARYAEQEPTWPESGRHILAQYDQDSIIVYQAYKPAIGRFAAQNGYFGGEFSYTRMSWCKPNFLWMMYRSGWATKEGQEITLAVRLKRAFFEEVLAQAVPSSYDAGLFPDKAEWSSAVAASEVRLQWDPDHAPSGMPVQRRAIQLGLRGEMLQEYGRAATLHIEDISDFVAEQRANIRSQELLTPVERVYKPADAAVAARLRLSG